MEKKSARSRLRGAERRAHTPHGHGPLTPSRSVTCPLLRPSTRHALMAERVTTCSCTHRHGKSVLVLHLCRRDHARRCLCVPAVALRRLCTVAVELQWSNANANRFWEMLCDWKGHLTASLPISCEAAPSWVSFCCRPSIHPPTTKNGRHTRVAKKTCKITRPTNSPLRF